MSKKIKVAVLGYGHLGKWHCQKVDALAQSELYAIVEKFPANQEAAKQNHPHAKIVADISEVINEIEAAVIVTPTSSHYELADYLLKNKKHVFCEKPLCAFYEEVLRLENNVDENLVLQVGHSERCHKAWEELAGEIAKIKSQWTLKINRVAAFKGRATDVDVVQDLMIHDIDLLLYVMKKNPISLRAYGNKIRTNKWDSATAEFHFEDGSVALLTAGRNHVKEIRDFEIMHDGGCLYVDLFKNEYALAPHDSFEDGSFVKTSSYEKRDHLLIEQERFYLSILEKKPIMVNFEDGKKAVYLIEKVLESLNTQKEVKLAL